MVEVMFGAKSRISTHIDSFASSPRKSPPKIKAVRAMTFYDASANADQKFIAPPKGHFFEKLIDSENILQKQILIIIYLNSSLLFCLMLIN